MKVEIMMLIMAATAVILFGGLSLAHASNLADAESTIEQQQTKIEALQERNAELTEELKELSTNYDAVRDELWNLNNYLEGEQ